MLGLGAEAIRPAKGSLYIGMVVAQTHNTPTTFKTKRRTSKSHT